MHMSPLSAHSQLCEDPFTVPALEHPCSSVNARANWHSPGAYIFVLYAWVIRGRSLGCMKVVIVYRGWINSVMRWAGWLMVQELPRCQCIDSLMRSSRRSKQLWDHPLPPTPLQSITNQGQQSCKYCLSVLLFPPHDKIIWCLNSMAPFATEKE